MTRLPAFLLCLLALSCGSAPGPAPVPVDNSETLHWTQEPLYSDNTPLDIRSILLYEIHASDNADWSDNTLRAALAGVDNVGEPVSAFNLSLLAAYGIGPGCYVTVRSISFDNIPSGYGIPCWWGEP